jgi:FAD synthetase
MQKMRNMIKNIQVWISHRKNKSIVQKNRIVMTFGTFDLFHPGHIYYLSEAKKLWDYLITVIARDSTVEQIKWKKPRESEKIRLQKVQNSGLVDEVILGSESNHYTLIWKKKPDVLCFGYDQRSFNNADLEVYLHNNQLHPEIIILPAFEPEKWKSSLIQ